MHVPVDSFKLFFEIFFKSYHEIYIHIYFVNDQVYKSENLHVILGLIK